MKVTRDNQTMVAEVRDEGGETSTVEADFVVDATGLSARIACKLGARRERDDQLVGVATYLERSAVRGPQDSFTLVEAVHDGWWYTAATGDQRLTLIRMTDADLLDTVDGRFKGVPWSLGDLPAHTRQRARR